MSRTALPTVQIGRTGLGLKTIRFEDGDTVAEAIKEAGLRLKDGEEIRSNCGADADLDTPLQDKDVYMLIPPVEGGKN